MKRKTLRGLYSPELLESRIAPATIIVNSLLDNGDGANTTLREAILLANDNATHPGADTIIFDPAILPGTITLNGTEIDITDTLTIKGPGIDKLTVSGNDASRIFDIGDGVAAVLHPPPSAGSPWWMAIPSEAGRSSPSSRSRSQMSWSIPASPPFRAAACKWTPSARWR